MKTKLRVSKSKLFGGAEPGAPAPKAPGAAAPAPGAPASGAMGNMKEKLAAASGGNPMGMIGLIVGVIVLGFVGVYIYKLYKKSKNEPLLIKNPKNATKKLTIPANQAPLPTDGAEFTYSFWIFVRDWNYSYGKAKCVLYRGDPDCSEASPSIWLYPRENKLMVRLQTFSYGSNPSVYAAPPGNTMNPIKWQQNGNSEMFNDDFVCDVSNIPLQRWVHVGLVLWNTTVDTYVNGKLARSCILPGVPKLNGGNIEVNRWGGFQGYMSRFKYFKRAVGSDEMYKTYLDGPFPPSFAWSGPKVDCNVGGGDS
tara:strand:+ start:350 stop:1276 length:927 start_codon:yes stop_codon:yes gene_type:complete